MHGLLYIGGHARINNTRSSHLRGERRSQVRAHLTTELSLVIHFEMDSISPCHSHMSTEMNEMTTRWTHMGTPPRLQSESYSRGAYGGGSSSCPCPQYTRDEDDSCVGRAGF